MYIKIFILDITFDLAVQVIITTCMKSCIVISTKKRKEMLNYWKRAHVVLLSVVSLL